MIGDGRTVTGLSLAAWAASSIIVKLARRRGFAVPPLSAVADVPPVPALVNWGSWKVECPECPGGAEDVWREKPLLFCMRCGNASVGGQWRPVTLPSDIDAVEAALAGLPRHEQNWHPPAGEEAA